MDTAAYIRTSKGDKKSTPERQEGKIREWCAQHGHTLVHIYQDVGGKRSEDESLKKRPQFQQMLADAKQGRFGLIVIEEQSRFGTSDVYAFMGYCGRLRKCGVQLWEAKSNKCLNPHSRDMGGVITSGIGAMNSSQEVSNTATRSLSEKLNRAAAGRWQGGLIMHGSAALCKTPAGVELWRVEIVDGQRVQIYPDGREVVRADFPRDRDRKDHVYLVPSRYPDRLKSIQIIFERFAAGSGSVNIAKVLNAAGYRLATGKPFTGHIIDHIVRRGVHYTGRYGWGQQNAGKYATRSSGQNYELVDNPTGKRKSRPHAEWLYSEPMFEPVISQELWDKTQARIADAYKPKTMRNSRCFLAGLVKCGSCGKTMTTNATKTRGLNYCCTSYRQQRVALNPDGCGCNNVKHEVLERLLARFLEDTGQALSGLKDGPGIAPLYSERGAAIGRLREIRQAIEQYLYENLGRFFDFKQKGKHRIFTVPMPGGPTERFRLPDFDGSPGTLEELCSLAENHQFRAVHARLGELRPRYEELYELYKTAPTAGFRNKLSGEISAVEQEIGRLEAELKSGLSHQLRGVMKQLFGLTRAVATAQRLLKEQQQGEQTAAAIRQVLSAIVCEFEFVMKGSQKQSHCKRVKFVPALGDEIVYDCSDVTVKSAGAPTLSWSLSSAVCTVLARGYEV